MKVELNHGDFLIAPETEFEKEILYEYFGGKAEHTVFLKHGLSAHPDYLIGLKIQRIKNIEQKGE